MLIICGHCSSMREWKKEQHERLADQVCECGGSYRRLDCLAEKCGYVQFAKCKSEGYCEKKKEGAN